MAKYRLSEEAKEDLIRIHHFGVEKFGVMQADKYFNSFSNRDYALGLRDEDLISNKISHFTD